MKFPKITLPVCLMAFLAGPFASGATLTVGAGSNTPDTSAEFAGTGGIAMLQLSLASSGGSSIQVTRLTLTAQGTLNDAVDLTATDLYVDANANGSYDAGIDVFLGSSLYSSDDGIATFTGFTRTISSGSSENWLVVSGFSASATPGGSFRTGVASNAHVSARYRSG
ncbi:MAG: hypothetical protein ACYS47_10890 [Planctomycetota bacterium]|jgi:hypothetical protein